MAKSTNVILLERLEPHGEMGEVVSVKPGFARNYLLPQKKALRATPANLAYFETQRKELEAQNESKKAEAKKIADKLEGFTLTLVRQAGDKGQLYGSVSSRDIGEALNEDENLKGVRIGRSMVNLNSAMKKIGLTSVEIILHPEVKVEIEVNVARNNEEARLQKKTGKPMIADAGETTDDVMARAEKHFEEQMEELLEEDAYDAAQEKLAEETDDEAANEASKEVKNDTDLHTAAENAEQEQADIKRETEDGKAS